MAGPIQSSINQIIGQVGAGVAIYKGISEQKAKAAKASLSDATKAKQAGTKLSTKNTIAEHLYEHMQGKISMEQAKRMGATMNKKERRQFKESRIGEVKDGNKQQNAGNV